MPEFESNYTLDKLFSNQIGLFKKEEDLILEKTQKKNIITRKQNTSM